MKFIAQGSREVFKGSSRTLPSVARDMVITALGTVLATKTTVWTINLLHPAALRAMAAAGCAHLLSGGGRGSFICSRFWLPELFQKQK